MELYSPAVPLLSTVSIVHAAATEGIRIDENTKTVSNVFRIAPNFRFFKEILNMNKSEIAERILLYVNNT